MSLFKWNRKVQYFNGMEYVFDGSEECEHFCSLTRISKKTSETVLAYTRLTFSREDILIKKEQFFEGELQDDSLEEEEKSFDMNSYPIRQIGRVIPDPDGMHYSGGKPEDGFCIPQLDSSLMVYIGMIRCKDPNFAWIGHDLHLISPIFMDLGEPMFVDYSDHLKPVVMNRDEVEIAFYNPLEEITGNSQVEFAKANFRVDFGENGDHIGVDGLAGVPNWDQEVLLPRCPKTGKLMRFVLQSLGFSKSRRIHASPEVQERYSYDKELEFSDGYLYVFYHPESGVACYYAQYT